MRKPSIRRLHALAAAMAVLFAMITSGLERPRVLCIASDGHISIESAADRCCEDAAEALPARSDRAPDGPIATSGNDCCRCTDIPLPSSVSQFAGDGAKAQPLAPSASLTMLPMSTDAVLVLHVSRLPRYLPEPKTLDPAHLRTLVLRC